MRCVVCSVLGLMCLSVCVFVMCGVVFVMSVVFGVCCSVCDRFYVCCVWCSV